MSIRRIVIVLTVLAAVFALSVGLVGAQATPAEGKWTGEINSADASVLVVSGVRFQAAGVQIDAGLILTPGTVVQVKFNAANGSLNAVKVERLEADDDDRPGTGKITGIIENATADTVIIGGVVFNVVGARIDDDVSLNAGSLVDLRFTFNGSTLAVNRIEAEDDENDAKAIGVIEAMDATTIMVGGVAFDITGAQFDDDGELAVGVLVEVEFTVTEDGRVIALDVEFEDDDDLFDDSSSNSNDDRRADFVLAGRIDAINGSILTVNSITVDINGANVDDDDTFEVGDAITIYFQRDASGALAVIEVDEIDDVDDPFDDDRDDDDDSDDSDDDNDNDDSSDDRSGDDVTVINGCVRPDGWQTYRVGRGDTMSRIAGAANTTVDALVAANCLTSANFITVGQQLFVPVRINRPDDDDDDDDDDNGGDDDDDDDDDDDNGGDDGGDDDDDDDDNGGGDDDDDDDDD